MVLRGRLCIIFQVTNHVGMLKSRYKRYKTSFQTESFKFIRCERNIFLMDCMLNCYFPHVYKAEVNIVIP